MLAEFGQRQGDISGIGFAAGAKGVGKGERDGCGLLLDGGKRLSGGSTLAALAQLLRKGS